MSASNGENGPIRSVARYSDKHGGWGLRFTYKPGAGLCGDRPFINCISGGWIVVYETKEAAEAEAERMLAETYGARDRYESVVPVRVERGQRQPSIAEEEEAEKIAAIRSAYEATINDLEAEVLRLREVERSAKAMRDVAAHVVQTCTRSWPKSGPELASVPAETMGALGDEVLGLDYALSPKRRLAGGVPGSVKP